MFSSKKKTSFTRTGIYTIAALICFFVILSLSGENRVQDSLSTFRVMIYNIHHGEGIDGVVNLERIANVINQESPDILLLQEVDVNLDRSGNVDIVKYLSDKTRLDQAVFGKNLDIEDGGYGNATLTRFPVTSSENYQFKRIGPEQRGVLAIELKMNDRSLLVLNSHFDHSEDDSERNHYAQKIIEEILPEYDTDAVLIGGDFNDIPTSQMYRKLTERFEDTWAVSGRGDGYTIPANQPSKRIDYIFYNGDIKSTSAWIPGTEASDHLPVVSGFMWADDK